MAISEPERGTSDIRTLHLVSAGFAWTVLSLPGGGRGISGNLEGGGQGKSRSGNVVLWFDRMS